MNRQGNAYTIIYATVLVVVVAAALAYAALALKPAQTKNIEIAKKSDILRSVNIASNAKDAETLYDKFISDSYVINSSGEKVEGVAFEIDLKVENAKTLDERKLPVFICQLDSNNIKYILPMRGKGLWGPIWGYVSFEADKKPIYGATYDHKGETTGLGAEISKEFFQIQFKGKTIKGNNGIDFNVVKGGAPEGDPHSVDAISGGTITSKGLEAMMRESLSAYNTFLNN